MKEVNELKSKIIMAGKRAVEQLIKVANEEIITGGDDDVSADRLKNAAASKKLAIFDAFEILSKIEEERERLTGETSSSNTKQTSTGFAWRTTRNRGSVWIGSNDFAGGGKRYQNAMPQGDKNRPQGHQDNQTNNNQSFHTTSPARRQNTSSQPAHIPHQPIRSLPLAGQRV